MCFESSVEVCERMGAKWRAGEDTHVERVAAFFEWFIVDAIGFHCQSAYLPPLARGVAKFKIQLAR